MSNRRVNDLTAHRVTTEHLTVNGVSIAVAGTEALVGNQAVTGTITVGEDATGYDVQFFGDTTGKYWKWDQANNLMAVTGGSAFSGNISVGVDDEGVDFLCYGATSGKYFMWDASADAILAECTVNLNEGAVVDATAASGIKHLFKDSAGKTLLATGTAVPADAGTLYAKGCLFIDTDVGTGTSGLYVNVGTAASCVFKLVTNA